MWFVLGLVSFWFGVFVLQRFLLGFGFGLDALETAWPSVFIVPTALEDTEA